MSNFGLPPKPTMPGPNASDTDRLKYQQDMQNYQFALQQAVNAITQEGVTKSNLQKAAHDAIMQMINNLR
ncbi:MULTISPECIES: hypothetical protein [Chloracidobacterium]|jgi:hypothetical protein|uniref:Uncharacterized protein n=1 Tax=Chloracidobacterium sp. N TaxID=2821540 RepID=A0ABX8B5Y9_9BACT|nr:MULTISPECIES: hypothetical protein [Chloracidobacterium]QUV86213.1 hypothetical protein J8C03_15685 [Chloracidobacterium sp. 2]QUV89341.1 hypothetical protein J8C07_11620 [Chloracidobacterium sp. S]QUV92655.1 hypothetical protein J8C04_12965 [Chloracidobacterium sp. A]QUV95130.1 hypothetical protein J8C05_13990 [Chloracidobacterium sp. N]QUV98340.1 hypothetical protein J8C00_15240 [Chloracidobacterium sp. E]